jgi:transcription termination factor Rho
MTVLTRDALEESPLADLHLIAGEVGLDGYRKLRKADLIDAIIDRQEEGEADPEAEAEVEVEPDVEAEPETSDDDEEERPARRSRRGARGGRGRRTARDTDADEAEEDEAEEAPTPARARRSSPRRDDAARRDDEDAGGDREERTTEGVVELLGNGSAFLRVSPPEPSDDDIYISAAQVRRCELVSGDTISGPVRAPRRSERFPSLARIDTINGRPADEVAEGTPFDELPATLPTERFALGTDDPTLKAVEFLTPIGRGSRVTITGSARAGKTEALRRLAGALAAVEGLELSLVLAGVRPEELTVEGIEPVAKLSFAASADARAQAIERAVETARRVAARGGHAAVLIDTLDGLSESVARRALASARAIADGGSLTVIATSSAPVGGETTVIALDVNLAATGRLPALDLVASGTVRPELLVGDAGAEAIAQARASALGL